MSRKLKLVVCCLALVLTCIFAIGDPIASADFEQSQPVDFARDIQPIFKQSCSPCHFGEKPKAELRLDNKALAMKGGISGAVIVPGKGRESRLIHRAMGEGGEKRMPLGGVPLTAAQIELLRRWIDEGAAWPDAASREANIQKHWAFIAPVRPALPEVRNRAWARTPIDRFVLAKLEKENLAPSGEADKPTLLRRLSLDLTGLPPTPEEVDAFLDDKSANAYEKQIERLLNSPHYGEKWGRQWLDAGRYADSDGYEKDKSRQVWFYRDWVINSLNKDKPYDRFVIEQIAGDLLPNATQEELVATGFLRNSMINEEGGIDPEQFRMEAMFDRMDAVGKAILGVTIQCAQCHNHKFDPIKQEEYYRVLAFLNNSHETVAGVYTPDQEMKRAEIYRRTREIEAGLQHQAPDWRDRMRAWEESVKNDQPEWRVIRPEVEDISTGGQRYLPLDDGSFLAQGFAPLQHRVKMKVKTDVQNITAFRLELMNDPNLPFGGPGRSHKGSCVLTEFQVEAAPVSTPDKSTKIKFVSASADVNPPESPLEAIYNDKSGRRRFTGPIEFAIDGKNETGWSIDVGPGLRNQARKAVFRPEKPITNESGTILTIYLAQQHGGWNANDHQNLNLGRIRLSITTATDAVADPLPAGVREAISIPRDRRSPSHENRIFSYWRTRVPEWKTANSEIAELWKSYPEGATQLVLQERAELRQTRLLRRGDFLRPDRVVKPGVPAFLHPMPEIDAPERLKFAMWLVDRNSPTAARAIVNRIWQSYFGTGLVTSSEDLGKQSDPPTHPELLDWLSVELMEPAEGAADNKKWGLKNIHRLIVKSAVYRQSSKATPESMAKDPYNRLLARGPRFRVDAEIVRDIALSASGLLNPKIGGASVYPPAPSFLFLPPASFGTKTWNEEKGENRYRRAVYTFRYRSTPYPALQAFDAPNGDIACVRRSRSNTPLQALTTLNEPLFVESARALALKTLIEGGATEAGRIEFAFRRVLARRPTVQEVSELSGLLNRQKARFQSGELNPWNLAVDDPDKPFPLPRNASMEDLAAWTAVSRVLLNLDETITKE